MNWNVLNSEEQLDAIAELSFTKPVVIFKHSTRCSISTMAKARLERSIQPEAVDFYYLDLLNYRSISNKVAELFSVPHESPQVLLIKNAECIYEETHNGIDMNEIVSQL
jgi:bacillithiol system protein YtxJ